MNIFDNYFQNQNMQVYAVDTFVYELSIPLLVNYCIPSLKKKN